MPSILGSRLLSIFGFKLLRSLGSMLASILGSRPNRAGFMPPNMLAEEALEVLGDDWECDVCGAEERLGVERPSLEEALARDGGRGEGPSRGRLEGDGRDFASLELGDCFPFPNMSMPCMPGIPGGIMPYMAASWWLGSIAAMAASRVELGFLGSSPRLARTIGSNLGFLGSSPSAASSMGSSVELAAAPALAADLPSAF